MQARSSAAPLLKGLQNTCAALCAGLIVLLPPLEARAWTFTPGAICRLSHDTADARIELTFDPAAPLYSVTVTAQKALPDAAAFSMTFIGPQSRTISTNRHIFNAGRTAVTATDTGFGNVLDGLQFNDIAEATLGGATFRFPLIGAAEPTESFRICAPAAGV